MDSGLSIANWSSLWSNQMENILLNKSSNELERDRNLINLNIICSNENISDINEECMQWLTHWESKQTSLSDTTTATDITFTAIQTMESTVFQDFTSNSTQISSDQLTNIPLYKWPFLLLGILVFIGGFGNILVCLAIGFERRLQNATNYFLLSLAVADLLVSVVVMPFGILNEFYGFWPFGPTICNLWVTCDVLCCSSSILHMCFISVGRYIGIKNPLHARQAPLLVSRRAVLLKIALAWLLSAVITSPLTIMAVYDRSTIQPEPLVCAISSRPFQILGSLSAFFCPMVVMLSSYVLTVRLLRRKAKFYETSSAGKESTEFSILKRKASSVKDHYLVNRTISSSSTSSVNSATSGNLQLMANRCSTSQHEMSCLDSRYKRYCSQIDSQLNAFQSHRRPMSQSQNNLSTKSESIKCKKKSTSRKTQPLMLRTLGSSLQVRNEQKATKVLGLVFFAFVICWAPFFSLNFMFGVLPDHVLGQHIPDEVTTTFLWLGSYRLSPKLNPRFKTLISIPGYVSSIINPIIYTIFNRNFRRAFKRIVLCQICANDSMPNSRRFSRTASQTRDNTTHKRSSASPAHQTSSKFCDISISMDSRETNSESNNHQNQSSCHNMTYRYNKGLSWKFNTAFNAHNNGSRSTQNHNKECSL